MSALLLLSLALAGSVAVSSVLGGRLRRRTPAPLLVAVHAMSLIGLGVFPILVGACLFVGGRDAAAHWSAWDLAGGILAVGWAAWAGWCLLLAARRARRVELRGAARAVAGRILGPGGEVVWVLPAATPLAYTGGLVRVRSVVSSGLLAGLSDAEAGAVLAHEVAHRRAGHARLLLWAGAVADAYRWCPPVQAVWSRLRGDVEACADDAAVAAVGRTALRKAVSRVVLARAGAGAGAGFGDVDTLRYRLDRLRAPRAPPANRGAMVTAAVAVATLGAVLAVAACRALSPDPGWAALLGCLAVMVLLVAPTGSAPVAHQAGRAEAPRHLHLRICSSVGWHAPTRSFPAPKDTGP